MGPRGLGPWAPGAWAQTKTKKRHNEQRHNKQKHNKQRHNNKDITEDIQTTPAASPVGQPFFLPGSLDVRKNKSAYI